MPVFNTVMVKNRLDSVEYLIKMARRTENTRMVEYYTGQCVILKELLKGTFTPKYDPKEDLMEYWEE
jgi:hypothetical protein